MTDELFKSSAFARNEEEAEKAISDMLAESPAVGLRDDGRKELRVQLVREYPWNSRQKGRPCFSGKVRRSQKF